MNAPSTNRRRLAGLAAVVGSLAVAAPSALADPPNRPRNLPQGQQSGLTHAPEIVSGLAASSEGRLDPRPEVIGGFAPPGAGRVAAGTTLVSQRGFNWGDAGVGAGTALLAAAAGGCALAIRRRVSLAH